MHEAASTFLPFAILLLFLLVVVARVEFLVVAIVATIVLRPIPTFPRDDKQKNRNARSPCLSLPVVKLPSESFCSSNEIAVILASFSFIFTPINQYYVNLPEKRDPVINAMFTVFGEKGKCTANDFDTFPFERIVSRIELLINVRELIAARTHRKSLSREILYW